MIALVGHVHHVGRIHAHPYEIIEAGLLALPVRVTPLAGLDCQRAHDARGADSTNRPVFSIGHLQDARGIQGLGSIEARLLPWPIGTAGAIVGGHARQGAQLAGLGRRGSLLGGRWPHPLASSTGIARLITVRDAAI